MKTPFILIVIAFLFGLSTFAKQRIQAIYGSDSRKDYYELDAFWRQKARSGVALVMGYNVLPSSPGMVTLRSRPFGENQNLCLDEKFYHQKQAAYCSGSLVGPDLVLTAGHCIYNQNDCAATSFVFDFLHETAHSDASEIAASKVYGCSKIVHRVYDGGTDFALIQLDRSVTDRPYLEISQSSQSIATGTRLVSFGHPQGIAQKYAEGTSVRSDQPQYFRAYLDVFVGNSGSPVFNRDTGLVEGVLVRGMPDYSRDENRQCYRSTVYNEQGAEAEEIVRMSLIAPHILAHNAQLRAAECKLRVNQRTEATVALNQTLRLTWEAPSTAGLQAFWFGEDNGVSVANQPVTNFSDRSWDVLNVRSLEGRYKRWMEVRNAQGDFVCRTNTVEVNLLSTMPTCELSSELYDVPVGASNRLRIQLAGVDHRDVKALWSGEKDGATDWTNLDLNLPDVREFQFMNSGTFAGLYTRTVDIVDQLDEKRVLCRSNPITVRVR